MELALVAGPPKRSSYVEEWNHMLTPHPLFFCCRWRALALSVLCLSVVFLAPRSTSAQEDEVDSQETPADEAPAPAETPDPAGGIGPAPAEEPAAPTPVAPAPAPPGPRPPQPEAQPRAPGQDAPPGAGAPQRFLPRSPSYKTERVDIAEGDIEVLEFIKFLADYTGLPVILDSTNQQIAQQKILIAAKMENVTGDIVIALLQANRFLVTRQVLPSGEEVLNVVSQQGAIQGPDEPKQNPLIRVDGSRVEEFEELLTTQVTSVRPDEIATMVFTLKYTQPADAIQSINNLIGGAKGGAKTQAFSVVDVKNSMLVIITAKFGLLNYLGKLLAIIDVPVKEAERIIQIIEVENADADELVQLIQTFLQGRGGSRFGRGAVGGAQPPGVAGGAVGGAGIGRSSSNELQTNLIADWRTQKIIVETYSDRDLEDIHMLVRELDARFDIRRLKTRIYQVRYLKADEVAADLQTLVGGGGGGLSGRAGLGARGAAGGAGAGAGGRRSRTGGIGRVGRQAGAAGGATPGVPGAAGAGGGNSPLPALIVPHIQTNSLIIQAEPEEYAEILNILDQIDVKRRQVFLEAALVEVTTGSQLNYTIELLAGEPNDRATRALFESSFGLSGIDFESFNRSIPDLSNPATVPPGALLAIMSRGKFPALVQFFKSNTDTQVLATPFVLADDNQANSINITETRYVQNTNISGGASGVTTTSNEGEEAGILLDITPTISSESAVFLEMALEVSQFQQGGTAQVLPPKTTNQVTSAVTIPDGEIFVIGGLTRENQAKAVSKVPLLGDIPLLGKLFRSETTSRSLSNLYIFLRAHILTHPEFDDGKKITEQAQLKIAKFAPHLNVGEFDKPIVSKPAVAPRNPDDASRFHNRTGRSKFPEGYEAQRSSFELVPPGGASTPSTYQGDPEAPDAGETSTAPRQPVPLAAQPQPRSSEPSEPTVAPEVEAPGGLVTELPPIVPPPTSTQERDRLNPPALDDTGMEIDPEGESWLVPLRRKR